MVVAVVLLLLLLLLLPLLLWKNKWDRGRNKNEGCSGGPPARSRRGKRKDEQGCTRVAGLAWRQGILRLAWHGDLYRPV
ncbi:hypothetical protein HOY80DRAFT_948314, partial [Tuber brumale]